MIRKIHKFSATMTVAAALLAQAATPAAQADPRWQALTGIPVEGTPVVAISETHAITVAAGQTAPKGGGVLVTTRAPDGTWSAPAHLGSAAVAWHVRIATNARGDVVVGWDDGTQHIAVRPAGQAFLPTVDLPDSTDSVNIDGATPQVGVNDAGEVTTAWIAQTDPSDTQLPSSDSVRYTTGSLTAPVQTVLASADASTGRTFQLRTAHQGPSVLVWGGDAGVSAVLRRAGEDFRPVQQITPAGTGRRDPVAAIDADGRAAVAFEGSEDGVAPERVELSRSDANGAFEPAAFVTPSGQDTKDPALAWPAGSDIHLAWQGSAASYDEAVTAVAPAAGPLGVLAGHAHEGVGTSAGVQVLAAAGGSMTFFQLADGGMRSVNQKLQDAETQETEHAVSEQPADWKGPEVASDDGGDAVAAWSPEATPWLIALSVWDATPPTVTISAPATVTAGQPFTLTLGATDALSSVTGQAVTIAGAFGRPVASPPVGADGTATATLAQPGTYAITGHAADAVGNAGTLSKAITVTAVPKPATVVVCRVPALFNHSVAYARRVLAAAHCALGRVTTPKKDKKRKGLVIRKRSRAAGTRATAGAHVNVTLGVKPKHRKRNH